MMAHILHNQVRKILINNLTILSYLRCKARQMQRNIFKNKVDIYFFHD